MLKGRTPDGVRNRWQRIRPMMQHRIRPGVREPEELVPSATAAGAAAPGWIGFTEQEDAIVIDSVRRLGCRWRKIAELLPGRSESAVRNRYTRLMETQNLGNGGMANTKAAHSAAKATAAAAARELLLPKSEMPPNNVLPLPTVAGTHPAAATCNGMATSVAPGSVPIQYQYQHYYPRQPDCAAPHGSAGFGSAGFGSAGFGSAGFLDSRGTNSCALPLPGQDALPLPGQQVGQLGQPGCAPPTVQAQAQAQALALAQAQTQAYMLAQAATLTRTLEAQQAHHAQLAQCAPAQLTQGTRSLATDLPTTTATATATAAVSYPMVEPTATRLMFAPHLAPGSLPAATGMPPGWVLMPPTGPPALPSASYPYAYPPPHRPPVGIMPPPGPPPGHSPQS